MRVGIDIRPLQLDAYKTRGIGTHLRSWIESAQTVARAGTFHLLFDPALPVPSIQLTSDHWMLCPFELPFAPLGDQVEGLRIQPDAEFVFDSAMESYLVAQEFDLFHATYPLMLEAFVARRLRRTRWIATIYDLIPIVFRDEYLNSLGEAARQSFAERLSASVYAHRVQTLSASSQSDLERFTGIPADKIDVIRGGVDSRFAPMRAEQFNQALAKLNLPRPYVLAVSGFHHAKNLRRVVEAYGLLPDTLRKEYGLVVVCPLAPQAKETIRSWCDNLGIERRVVLLQDLSPAQVVALYNGATLLAHPALYEGWGLPVLEAMRCGTPVLTSTVSSLPEVAGQAAVLVDPTNSQEIARGMTHLLTHPDLRAELCERGIHQASQFTWDDTARRVLESYARALDLEPSPMHVFSIATKWRHPLRLAFWSPLNPRRSGISDYSESLLAAMREYAQIDVFVDGYQPSNLPLLDHFPTYDAKAYPYVALRAPYDLNLYQIGNNRLHRYMYDRILGEPGIITLHDVCVYHLIHAVLAGGSHPERFWQEVAYCEGSEVAQKARIEYVKGQLDDYSLSLNRRLVEASRGVITHSDSAAKKLERYRAVSPLRIIPFGISILEDDQGKFARAIRHALDIPEDAFVFGVFGHIHRVKRIPVILRAFARVRAKLPNTCLLIMGPLDPSAADAIRPLQTNLENTREQGIYLDLTYADHVLRLMMVHAIDVGINLRYPTAGETSASLSTFLGMGKPTLVSAVSSFLEYPDSCCPKVPIDQNEEAVLFQHMFNFAVEPNSYRQAAEAAYNYCRDKSWDHCAQAYLQFVEDILSIH
ncbi:D-inositol 3-phosphate glycosyltransferase [Anaerolineae bacterium]|nr:D-inositol 3-phosphate glycosyltransferase [Anaerolineae bacterium]